MLLPILTGSTFVSFNDTVKLSRKFCVFWIFACQIGTLSWVVYPLAQCASCRMLPMKSWYPIDVVSWPNYEIAFVLQFFGQVFVGVGSYSFGSFGVCLFKTLWTFTGYGICGGIYCTFVWMLCGQYDILYASLKNLGEVVTPKDPKISKNST